MASQFARENHLGRPLETKCLLSRIFSLVRPRAIGRPTGLLAAFCFAGFIMAGCVDDVPELVSDDPVLQQGRDIYVARCVSCHGATGAGGLGTKLNDGEVAKKYPNIADQIDVVTNGKNQMAAFKDTLTENEIEAVVRYTREGL